MEYVKKIQLSKILSHGIDEETVHLRHRSRSRHMDAHEVVLSLYMSRTDRIWILSHSYENHLKTGFVLRYAPGEEPDSIIVYRVPVMKMRNLTELECVGFLPMSLEEARTLTTVPRSLFGLPEWLSLPCQTTQLVKDPFQWIGMEDWKTSVLDAVDNVLLFRRLGLYFYLRGMGTYDGFHFPGARALLEKLRKYDQVDPLPVMTEDVAVLTILQNVLHFTSILPAAESDVEDPFELHSFLALPPFPGWICFPTWEYTSEEERHRLYTLRLKETDDHRWRLFLRAENEHTVWEHEDEENDNRTIFEYEEALTIVNTWCGKLLEYKTSQTCTL